MSQRVLLCVSASVAVYKACELASQLTQAGPTVRVAMTANAARLIRPQLFEALTGERAYVSEFEEARKAAMDHIDLAKWAQLVVAAPASADLIGRLAHGLADDLVTTVALALPASTPRLLAPAMNPVMLEHPAVQRNVETLIGDGWELLPPDEGPMACGDEGQGRLPSPATIQARILERLGS